MTKIIHNTNMVKKPLLFLSLLGMLASSTVFAKPIIVAVIDTGFGFRDKGHDVKLCNFGHKDFTTHGIHSLSYGTVHPIPTDLHGHGTNIAGAIHKFAGDANYCLVILKYYKDEGSGPENLKASTAALRRAVNLKVDVINYSGGGQSFDTEEKKIIVQFLDSGGILIAAAGNEGKDLDVSPFYPAKYDDRIVVVGNGKNEQNRQSTSNYGSSVKHWEIGTVQMYGYSLSGTSQATAITTGKTVNERFRKSKSKRERNSVGQ